MNTDKKPFYYNRIFLNFLFIFGGLTLIPPFIILGVPVLILAFVLNKKSNAKYPQYSIKNIEEFEEKNKLLGDIEQIKKQKENTVEEANKLKEQTEKEHEELIEKTEKEYEHLKESKIKEIEDLEKIIDDYSKELTVKYIDTRDYSDITSAQIKNEISLVNLKIKELIKSGKAVRISYSDSNKRDNNLTKQILKNFTSDANIILNKLTLSNVDSSRARIIRAFELTNKTFVDDCIKINKQYLNLKLEELNLYHQYNLKLEQEKEQQKAIREQMVEEEKVRREIEREKRKIEKEEIQFRNEQNKLMLYLNKAKDDIEKKLYLDKIKDLEEKLKLLEVDKKNVFDREANTRAGFVYVISNIGSFGEDIYKIGMTRRLEPMDRIKELGSASVPFEFDVHAMIFSDDAPSLETTLHQKFRDREVNKVNQRKEFFKVPLSEIEQVVKENYNATVEFTEIAKAEQYRQTLAMTK